MSWGKTILSTTILGATIAGFTTFKSINKAHTFYYYPELNVYYNVQEKSFAYSIDGGQSWLIMKANAAVSSSLGKRVVLNSNAPEIWKSNEIHRNKYGGYLVDLVKAMQTPDSKKTSSKKKKAEKSIADVKAVSESDSSGDWKKQYVLDSTEEKIKAEAEQAAKADETDIQNLDSGTDTSTVVADSTRYW